MFLEFQLGSFPSFNNADVSWEKHATCVLCGLPVSCSQWFSDQVWPVSFSVSPPVYLDTSSWDSFVILFCFETFVKLIRVSVPFFVYPWHLGVLNKDFSLYLCLRFTRVCLYTLLNPKATVRPWATPTTMATNVGNDRKLPPKNTRSFQDRLRGVC